MNKIGLVICGNSGVDYLDLGYPLKVIRSILILDGKEYTDFIDIEAEDFYSILGNNPDIDVKTSQTSTGTIVDVYEELKKEGYKDILVITVGSKLSGVHQGAILAKDIVEGLNIAVIDSKSVSYGEIILAKRAIEMINCNHSLEEIERDLNVLKEKIEIYVLVDTLKYLVKNGRLSIASGFLGTLLKIKPLLKINEEGSLVPYEKIRTTKKARERLLKLIKKELKDVEAEVFLAYTNNKKLALEIKEELFKFNTRLNIEIVPLTPVVGAHAGPGTLGIGYIKK